MNSGVALPLRTSWWADGATRASIASGASLPSISIVGLTLQRMGICSLSMVHTILLTVVWVFEVGCFGRKEVVLGAVLEAKLCLVRLTTLPSSSPPPVIISNFTDITIEATHSWDLNLRWPTTLHPPHGARRSSVARPIWNSCRHPLQSVSSALRRS